MNWDLRRVIVLFYLASNLALSISIVLLNKWLYQEIAFPNLTLTFIHFVVTSLGLVIASKVFGLFKVKPLPLIKMLPLSVSFCGSIVLANLSLQFNTVGTYQIIKLLTMPCVMLIQTWLHGKFFSWKVPIVLGTYMSSIYDIKFNLLGIFYALVGVAVASAYQVLVATKQKEFDAPMSAAWLLVIIPFVEPPSAALLSRTWTSLDLMLVMSSGLIALFINITTFAIIGKTSPLTYNVLGQLKMGLSVVSGFLLFHDSLHESQLAAILVTWTGVALYTWIRMTEEKGETRLRAKSSVIKA